MSLRSYEPDKTAGWVAPVNCKRRVTLRRVIMAALATVGVGLLWAGRQLMQEKEAQGKPAARRPRRAPVQTGQDRPQVEDDLTRIKGLGPKAASVLNEAGVTSFSQLAAMDVSSLRRLLRYKVSGPNPATWPEQAAELS